MKCLLFFAIFISSFTQKEITNFTDFNRLAFYSAMRLNDLVDVNAQLAILEKDTSNSSQAFTGAMLMKKAGLVRGPFKKIKLFKAGHSKLESAISKEGSNPEFYLLRLMIQENAPAIVNYSADIKKDSDYIISAFKDLPKELQSNIIDYSKVSKALSKANFTP